MKLTDKRFGIAWLVLLLLVIVSCITEGVERGYSIAWWSLCAVVVINLAVSEGKTESCLRQSDCDDSL